MQQAAQKLPFIAANDEMKLCARQKQRVLGAQAWVLEEEEYTNVFQGFLA